MKTISMTAFMLLLLFSNALSESTRTAGEEKLEDIEGEARVKALIDLSTSFYERQPDKAIGYAREALDLARIYDNRDQIIQSYRLLAGSFVDSDIYDSAKFYYTGLANYAISVNDSLLLAESLSNIGYFYYLIHDYKKAIRYYDSANVVYDDVGKDDNKLYNDINISIIHTVLGDVRSSLEVLKKNEKKLIALDKKPQLATIFTSIGDAYKKLGIYDSSRIYINKALELAKETDNTRLIIFNLINLGDIEKNEGSLDKALKYYLKAIESAEKTGIESYIATGKINTAVIYRLLDSNELAKKNYRQAFDIFRKINDKKGMAVAFSMFGDTYLDTKMYDSAYASIDKAINIFSEIEDKNSEGMAHIKLASVLRKLKEFDQARYHLNIALGIFKETENKDGLAGTYTEFGKVYQKSGNYKKSAEYLEMAIDIFEVLGNRIGLADCYSTISETYKKLDDYKNALDYYFKYIAVKEATLAPHVRKEIMDLKSYHDLTKEREKTSALERQKAEITADKARIIVYFAVGILVAAVISLILYRKYRMRIKLGNKLRQKNLELGKVNDELRKTGMEKDQLLNLVNTEIDRAASYVVSLINPPIDDGIIRTKWKFVPSRRLGGDCFGYHWIDDDNFSIYLLDVSGHGIGPALHAVSVMNLLCNENLTGVDFRRPEQVLNELNKSLKMDSYDGMFLTVFYFIYNKKTRELRYAEAGHPPALLFDNSNLKKLKVRNFVIGGDMKYQYRSESVTVTPGSDLYIYSDGAYEIEKADGEMMQMEEMAEFIRDHRNHDPNKNELDDLYLHLLRQQRTSKLEDDFSILKVTFL